MDVTFRSAKDTSIEAIDDPMRKASETCLKGILGYCDQELVSTDLIHDDRSSIYDSLATRENLKGESASSKIVWRSPSAVGSATDSRLDSSHCHRQSGNWT